MIRIFSRQKPDHPWKKSHHEMYGLEFNLDTKTSPESSDEASSIWATGKRKLWLKASLVLASCSILFAVGLVIIYSVWLFVGEAPQDDLLSQHSVSTSQEFFTQSQTKWDTFFTSAGQGLADQPMTFHEDEFNAFLAEDKRFGALRGSVIIEISDGNLRSFFDFGPKQMGVPWGEKYLNLRGSGLFRFQMRGRNLLVIIDQLSVNGRDIHALIRRMQNPDLFKMAKKGAIKTANLGLRLIGRKMDAPPAAPQKPLLVSLAISSDTTRDIFKSFKFRGEGKFSRLLEPVQLTILNQIFNLHSDLHESLLSMERIELHEDAITFYPRRSQKLLPNLLDRSLQTSNR
ncbi:MAG: hypothetical protein P8L18_09675 [Verrucomicrobiota bacterium]|nr:hypothetical protein [Verrucomicrobiota bacterium]